MFLHNLKYSLKTLFKNKTLIFWTFAFPLILGTLFQMAFQDIEKNETLDTISIAIVEEKENNIKNIFEELEIEDKKMFSIFYGNEEEAKEKLEQSEISGYLILSDTPKIIVKENGINQTILKYVVGEIIETEEIMNNMITYEISQNGVLTNEFYQTLYENIKKI